MPAVHKRDKQLQNEGLRELQQHADAAAGGGERDRGGRRDEGQAVHGDSELLLFRGRNFGNILRELPEDKADGRRLLPANPAERAAEGASGAESDRLEAEDGRGGQVRPVQLPHQVRRRRAQLHEGDQGDLLHSQGNRHPPCSPA